MTTENLETKTEGHSLQDVIGHRELESTVDRTKDAVRSGAGGMAAMTRSLSENPPTVEEAKLLLKTLCWDVNMVITNYDGEREIVVDPDIIADFTALPFADGAFALVVFDPPHIQRNGDTSWLLKKYGVLRGAWREMLTRGFAECFRVLRPEGTLIFKWCEIEIPLREILALTPQKPLFGHRTGKQAKTHWVAFIKAAGTRFDLPQGCDSTTEPSGG